MNQIKTLVVSEYKKRKSSYWWPVWIITGLVSLTFLAALTALILHRSDMITMDLDFGDGSSLATGMYGVMFSFSLIFLAFMGLGAQMSLNRESQLGSDLFFRCQPVSFWKVTGVKYVMHVYGSSVLLLGVGLIFSLILSILSAIFGNGFLWGQALCGAVLGWLNYLKLAMVFGSLCFLFSGIFKNNALLKGAAVLGLLEGLLAIIEAIFRHNVVFPDVFVTLGSMVGSMGLNEIGDIRLGIVFGDTRILFGVLFAALCYVLGSLIYNYRAKEA